MRADHGWGLDGGCGLGWEGRGLVFVGVEICSSSLVGVVAPVEVLLPEPGTRSPHVVKGTLQV